MAKETEREEIKEETHELEDEEKDELEDEEDEDVDEEMKSTSLEIENRKIERSCLLVIPWKPLLKR